MHLRATTNIEGTQAQVSTRTLSQFLPEHPEMGESVVRILNWVDGFARIFYSVFFFFYHLFVFVHKLGLKSMGVL